MPERTFSFGDTKFISFLGTGRFQAESRIVFLGKDMVTDDLNFTFLNHDKTFQKSREKLNMNKWSIQKFNIEPFDGLKKQIRDIK